MFECLEILWRRRSVWNGPRGWVHESAATQWDGGACLSVCIAHGGAIIRVIVSERSERVLARAFYRAEQKFVSLDSLPTVETSRLGGVHGGGEWESDHFAKEQSLVGAALRGRRVFKGMRKSEDDASNWSPIYLIFEPLALMWWITTWASMEDKASCLSSRIWTDSVWSTGKCGVDGPKRASKRMVKTLSPYQRKIDGE